MHICVSTIDPARVDHLLKCVLDFPWYFCYFSIHSFPNTPIKRLFSTIALLKSCFEAHRGRYSVLTTQFWTYCPFHDILLFFYPFLPQYTNMRVKRLFAVHLVHWEVDLRPNDICRYNNFPNLTSFYCTKNAKNGAWFLHHILPVTMLYYYPGL